MANIAILLGSLAPLFFLRGVGHGKESPQTVFNLPPPNQEIPLKKKQSPDVQSSLHLHLHPGVLRLDGWVFSIIFF